jgi:hypothetical protein
MQRWIKSLRETLTAIAALGVLSLLWLFVTQVIAIAPAVVVGLLVTMASGWQTGLLAGILAYAVVMKLVWYLEIFDMIGLPSKKRAKLPSKHNSNP